MRTFFSLVLLVLILSCRNMKDKKQTFTKTENKNPRVQPDTFNLRDIDFDRALQKDILLDSIEIPESNKHLGLSIVYPKLSPKRSPYIYKWVKRLVQEKENEFYEDIKDEDGVKVKDSSNLRWYAWMEPRLLYQAQGSLSLVFGHGGGFNFGTSWFGYRSLNFDLAKKREITISDYFILRTITDSSFLEHIFQRCVNNEFDLQRNPINDIRFAFDSTSVYFLFDKYDTFGSGIFSVEKKYILEHINPAYR